MNRILNQALLFPVHLALALLLPPLLLGIINKVKALVAGRKGPPVLQLYHDLARLFRKDAVIPATTTAVFFGGPIAAVAAGLAGALLVPMGSPLAPVGFGGDLVVLAYLFALSRFLTILSALDTGSAFEGMGAAREATFAVLAEPALFMGLAVLVRHTGRLSLGPMLAGADWHAASGPLALVLAAWLIVYLVENCRIPFDDPNTHLELTMIHEVMVLDHSGPAFGLVLHGASLKLFVLGALIVRLCLPFTGRWWLDWPAFVLGLLALAAAVGVVESAMARLRMTRVPQLLIVAILSATFGFLVLLLQPALH